MIAAIIFPALLFASPPPWWTYRGVVDSTKPVDDYSTANQGQVKQIALGAYQELQDRLPGGAGPNLTALIASWRSPTATADDFSIINVGQLKNIAKPFYDRLIANGYANSYPWAATGQNNDDFAAANIGQVKALFSFDLSGALGNPVVATGSQAIAWVGGWVVSGTDIYDQDRRGYVDYSLNVPTGGIYNLQVQGAANANGLATNNFDLVLLVDGVSLGHFSLWTRGAASGKIDTFTPWLPGGTHVFRIFYDNSGSVTTLRVKSISLRALPGLDIDSLIASRNNITASGDSFVSPAFIEGRSKFVTTMSATSSAGGTTTNLAVRPGPDQTWYTDVPLVPSANNAVTVSYENGGLSQATTIHWMPKNIVGGGDMTIRKGDSLLLTAYPSDQSSPPTSGSSTINVASTQYSTTPGQPVTYQFSAAGTYLISGSYTSGGQTSSGSITVTVVSYNFSPTPDCWVGKARVWDIPALPSGIILGVDSRVLSSEAAPASGGNQHLLIRTDANEPRYVVARIGSNGPILAAARLAGFNVFGGRETYNYTVKVYSDGSRLAETMIIASPVLVDLTVKVTIIVGGVTFEDGTTVKNLTFDSLGQCVVRFLMPAAVQTANCHRIDAYQDTVLVGEY